jgi:UDP-3-O-[3-hydroxymyristoyl] N-acetylglucosamine deacetylase
MTSAVTRTVRAGVVFNGIGLHGGQAVAMQVAPAPAGHGIVFRRTDLAPGTGDIPARWDLVVDTRLCTRLGNAHGASVGTVEHLMAALAGCGVTDALVSLAGPEVPIMDGSAAPFVSALLGAGIVETGRPLRAVRIREQVVVEQDGKRAELLPANRFEMDFSIEFDDPAIGSQRRALALVNGAFVSELGDCRTFGHLCEVEQLRAMGLARGGSLQNAIVVDRGRVLNPEGLRRPDEFVRHKMLDAVGDLALAGAPIVGRYVAHRGGHEMTNRLLRALFARPHSWCWVDLRPGQWFGGAAEPSTWAPEMRRDLGKVAV